MGSPYTILNHRFQEISCDKNTDIVVEIGSGWGDGSTAFLCRWAKSRGLPFYTIDIDPQAHSKLKHLDATFVIQSGHEWCKTVLPSLNKTIKVLYLDNFDYPWPAIGERDLDQQREEYERRGLSFTAKNSMEEHRLQTQYCLPYMSDESVILMDDTYYDPMLIDQGPDELPQWQGKCVTAMPLMIAANYKIIRDQEYNINYATRNLIGNN
jgi:hypothetical protein